MERYTLEAENSLILVVDCQERLAPAMPYRDQVVCNILLLAETARVLKMPALILEQYPKGLGPTLEVIREAFPGAPVVEKVSYSGWQGLREPLAALGKKKVIVVGMETHVCVFQTVRDLLAHGCQVFIAADAVASRRKLNYRVALELMAAIGAVITTTEGAVFDLLQQADTPEFRALLKVIK